MKNKDIIITILVTFISTFGILGIIGMNIDEEVTPTETKTETQTTAEMYKKSFVDGCAEESGDIKSCECMYDSLIEKYGLKEILEMSVNYIETGKLDNKFYSVIPQCVK